MGKSASRSVRLVATDEHGIVRVVVAPSLAQLDAMEAVARWGDGDKKQGVECSALHVDGGEEGKALLALGRASGETHVIDPETGATLATIPPPPVSSAAAEDDDDNSDDNSDDDDGGDGNGKSSSKKNKDKKKKKSKSKSKSKNPVRGVAFLYDAVGTGCTRFPLLVVASASGHLRVFAPPPSASSASASGSGGAPWSLVSKLETVRNLRALALSHSVGVSGSNGSSSGSRKGTKEAAPTGIGGCVVKAAVVADGCELSVWDLSSREKIFDAKGEKPDRLRLVDKPGGTSVCFLPDDDSQVVAAAGLGASASNASPPSPPSGASSSPTAGGGGCGGGDRCGKHLLRCSGNLIAVGTATGRVRLYDARHGKRPVSSVVLSGDGGGGRAAGCSTAATASSAKSLVDGGGGGKKRVEVRNNGLSGAGSAVVALAPEAGGAAFCRVWAGDAAGLLRSVDLRTARPEGVLKGSAGGGVRCVAPHPRASLVASVGADGFLRVHHARSRKLVGSLWLKQPLRSVCWCPPRSCAGVAAGKDENNEKEKEKKNKSKKRRRKESDDGDDSDSSSSPSSSSSSDSDSDSDDSDDDEQAFLEEAGLTLFPPEEKGSKKKRKKRERKVPPLPGAKKEKKARKKGSSAKKNRKRKEAAKAAKAAKRAAGGRGGGGGGGGGGE